VSRAGVRALVATATRAWFKQFHVPLLLYRHYWSPRKQWGPRPRRGQEGGTTMSIISQERRRMMMEKYSPLGSSGNPAGPGQCPPRMTE